MNYLKFIKLGFLSAAGVFIYVSVIALFMFNAEDIFGEEDTFIIPVFMLLLFVVSASITGLLVLGKPVLLYLDGHKKDALMLFFATLSWLISFLIVIVATLLFNLYLSE